MHEGTNIDRGTFSIAPALGLLTILFAGVAISGQQAAQSGQMTRKCNPDADASKGKMKTHASSKKRNQSTISSGAACLDVRESSLAVQEYLQKFVREQRWNIGEEQVSEDTWTFSRYLKKEELGEFAQPWKGPAIEWRSAKMLINVRTTELPDGYTRTLLIIRIEGYGELQDQFATKRESWTLESNGTLESALTAVLSKNFENSH